MSLSANARRTLAYRTGVQALGTEIADALDLATTTGAANTAAVAVNAAAIAANATDIETIRNLVIVTDATTARTLGLTDGDKYIRFTNGSAVTVTVPPQVTIAWGTGVEITIEQAGAGLVTVAAGAGVTVSTSTTLKANGQFSVVKLKRTASNNWTLTGDRSLV